MVTSNTLYPAAAYPTNIGKLPDENGPRTAKFSFALTANVPQNIDIFRETSSGALTNIQGIFIDNWGNTSALTITLDDQRLVCPPNAQGILPVLRGNMQYIGLLSTADAVVAFELINTPTPYAVWGL
jgi:hypothetical protein